MRKERRGRPVFAASPCGISAMFSLIVFLTITLTLMLAGLAMARAGVPPEKTVMVGDRLYTDITAGHNAGVDTVFVLSGEGTLTDLEASQVKPTWVFDSLAALHRAWERERDGHCPDAGA